MSIVSPLEQELIAARTDRDRLVKAVRHLLRNTGIGYGLANTINTANGQETSSSVDQAIAAIMELVERDKQRREEHGALVLELRTLQDEKRTVQNFFFPQPSPTAGVQPA